MHNNKKLSLISFIDKMCSALSFAFWFSVIFGFENSYTAVLTILCAIIHEFGHILASRLLSAKYKISAVSDGFRLNIRRELSYKETALVALCGPLINITMSALFLSMKFFINIPSDEFIIINLLTALANLLPIKGYDGFNILSSIIMILPRAEKISQALLILSDFLSIVLCVFSLYLISRLNCGYWMYFIFLSSMLKSLSAKTLKKRENASKSEKIRD